MSKALVTLPPELVENSIILIRGLKVILDRDLARLYGVETKVLNQAVKRNLDRFPKDFMFQLTREESKALSKQITGMRLRSQSVTLKPGRGQPQHTTDFSRWYLNFNLHQRPIDSHALAATEH